MPKEATYIRLDPAIKRAAERAATADQRSLSSFIAKLITEWMQKHTGISAKEKRR
jgi:hypothetical protein